MYLIALSKHAKSWLATPGDISEPGKSFNISINKSFENYLREENRVSSIDI
jgi:hypothetical protein